MFAHAVAAFLTVATVVVLGVPSQAGAAAPLGQAFRAASGIASPVAIANGPDGNLWFANAGGNSIGRISPGGVVSNFSDATISNPEGIAAGPDGSLWFTNSGNNSIGRISVGGVVSNFSDATINGPRGITAGPDGNLWFANSGNNSIGRITVVGAVSSFSDGTVQGPRGIITGGDGNLWFTNGSGNSVGRITPAGTISNFTGVGIAAPMGITKGPDGALWFTNSNASIGRITTTGVVSNFTGIPIDQPSGITTGSDGNLWFSNYGDSTIGRITPTGVVSGFSATALDKPTGIAAGPDGNLWFTNSGWDMAAGNNSIGRITPAGVVSNFAGNGIDDPERITLGADGNLWFANRNNSSIGRITPGGVVSTFAVPGNSTPYAIAAGPDGNVWFTSPQTNRVGQVTPAGVVTMFTDPTISLPLAITAGPDGNVWFANSGWSGTGSIGRITPGGVVSSFTGPGVDQPQAITAGGDGNLWFANFGDNSIGRITPAGVVSHFTDPSISNPIGMALGSDGNVWFTNHGTASIGRITPAGVVAHFADPALSTPYAIAAGPDGNLWFTNGGAQAIGRITPAGAISVFATASLGSGDGIVSGPDGNLWFTASGNSIGYIGSGLSSVPAAPSGVSGFGGSGSVTISWNAPPYDGGSPITSYTVTAAPGGATCGWSSGPLACTISGLTDGSPYTFTVTAHNGLGDGPPSSASSPVMPGSSFHALAPVRVLDSRPGLGNAGGYTTPWGTGTKRDIAVGGLVGVPSNADAVVLNVTVTGTTGSSFLSIWPAGQVQPTASSLNWTPGRTIPNAVTVKLGAGGKISVFNLSGNVDVIADVAGYYDHVAGDGFSSSSPARILDSRPGIGNVGGYASPWGTGTRREVSVGGLAGVPATADAVVLNVTVTGTTGSSYLSIWPAGQAQPTVSSLNWTPGVTIPNAVTVKLGAAGKISVFNLSGNVDVIADVAGYYQSGTGKAFHALTPGRVLDSRAASHVGPYTTPWTGATSRDVPISGLVGVPADADAVVANVTVTDTTAGSFLTVWPAGVTRPNASSLNWAAGVTIPNAVTVKLGTSGSDTGKVTAYNLSGSVDVIADVAGWFG